MRVRGGLYRPLTWTKVKMGSKAHGKGKILGYGLWAHQGSKNNNNNFSKGTRVIAMKNAGNSEKNCQSKKISSQVGEVPRNEKSCTSNLEK